MATSGSATFNPDFTELAEEAFDMAGVEMRSGYHLRSARRSLNTMFLEWANRGINLWTVESGTQALTAGTASYTLPSDTIDLIEHSIRTNSGNVSTQSDTRLNRISVSTYSAIPNKLSKGLPIQIYIDRQTAAPVVNLYPVPDDVETYTLFYYRIARIEDVGSPGSNTLDLPARFLPCATAGLAYYLSVKHSDQAERVLALKAMYDEQWQLASSEDREKASVRFVPFVSRN
jgi:hypothetical protein|tara:strand:+ start:786 stop:1478 length:693 start_codon:yes stop_codon:yes gene_type:complete